jgi:hypothetical protein
MEHAVIGVEVFDGGTPSGGIALPDDLLKVSRKKFENSLRRSHVDAALAASARPDPFDGVNTTVVRFHSLPRAWSSPRASSAARPG